MGPLVLLILRVSGAGDESFFPVRGSAHTERETEERQVTQY